jgi:hypothetical protein
MENCFATAAGGSLLLQDFSCKTLAKVPAEDLSLVDGPWLNANRLFYRARADLFVMDGDDLKERLLCAGFHAVAKTGHNIFRGQQLCLVHDRELNRVAGNSFLPTGSLSLVFMDASRQVRRETDLDSFFTEIAGVELDLAHRYCVLVGSCKRNACISIYSFDQSLALSATSTKVFERFSAIKRFPLTNTLVVSGKSSLFVYSLASDSPRPSLELLREFKLNTFDEVSDFVFLKSQVMVCFEGRRELTLIDVAQPQQKYDQTAALIQELNSLGAKRVREEQIQPPAAAGDPSITLEKSEDLKLPAGNIN